MIVGTGASGFVPTDNTKAYQVVTTDERFSWCTIQSKPANGSGTLQVFGPTEPPADGQPGNLLFELQNPGDSYVIWSPASLHLEGNLRHIYIKVANNNGTDGVNISRLK